MTLSLCLMALYVTNRVVCHGGVTLLPPIKPKGEIMDSVIRRWKCSVRFVESLSLALSFQAVDRSCVSLLVNPTIERTRGAGLASSAIEGPPVMIYEQWDGLITLTLRSYPVMLERRQPTTLDSALDP